jgi:hypothetical protein
MPFEERFFCRRFESEFHSGQFNLNHLADAVKTCEVFASEKSDKNEDREIDQ